MNQKSKADKMREAYAEQLAEHRSTKERNEWYQFPIGERTLSNGRVIIEKSPTTEENPIANVRGAYRAMTATEHMIEDQQYVGERQQEQLIKQRMELARIAKSWWPALMGMLKKRAKGMGIDQRINCIYEFKEIVTDQMKYLNEQVEAVRHVEHLLTDQLDRNPEDDKDNQGAGNNDLERLSVVRKELVKQYEEEVHAHGYVMVTTVEVGSVNTIGISGVARCSPDDTFYKSTGRFIAGFRALKFMERHPHVVDEAAADKEESPPNGE